MGSVLWTLGLYAFFKSFPIDFFTVASCFNKGDIHDHVLLQILVFGVMDLALVIGFRPWGHFVMGSCHPLFIESVFMFLPQPPEAREGHRWLRG